MIGRYLDDKTRAAADFTARVNWTAARNAFARLDRDGQAIAVEGMRRHIGACLRTGVEVTYDAAKEIISDARASRRVWDEPDAKTGMAPEEL